MNLLPHLPAHLRNLGLERNPFPQTPDADCYFRTASIERQFVEASHCVLAGKGFMLLTGEVGTGKSTFLRYLMDQLIAERCTVAFVFNTFLQGRDLLLAINRDFGLTAGADFAEDIDRLNRFLIERHAAGNTCVLVIDDAQNLDHGSLELLRLLSNLETRQNKLLQIILSGQPELLEILAKPEIRQFYSRIVQHTQLTALTPDECARYVEFRIARACSGGEGIVLDRAARDAVFRHSKGNPRRVHLIMDRCMYGVIAGDRREIGKQLVDLAAGEIGVAPRIRPPRRARNWTLILLAFLGLGVAAWAGAPSSVAPKPAPTPASITPPLDGCLEKLGADKWKGLLQNGLNPEIQPAIERALAESGLALIGLPAASSLPSQVAGACRWENAAGAWLLWHPAHAPFELQEGARGENVRWLQTRLSDAGDYAVPVDGVVGVRTFEALRAFRGRHGLAADGGADAMSLYLLEHEPGNIRPGNIRQGKDHA